MVMSRDAPCPIEASNSLFLHVMFRSIIYMRLTRNDGNFRPSLINKVIPRNSGRNVIQQLFVIVKIVELDTIFYDKQKRELKRELNTEDKLIIKNSLS